MKALLSLGFAGALAISAEADEKKFDAIALDYAAMADLVSKLDRVILDDVKIVDLPIGEAVTELQKLGVKGSTASGVINVVVRAPETAEGDPRGNSDEDDPFAGAEQPEPYYPETVSLTADSISFAAAIDELCKRAGYIWSVDMPKPTMPCLNLRPNPSGQQGGTGQPATHSKAKSEGSDNPQPETEGRSR